MVTQSDSGSSDALRHGPKSSPTDSAKAKRARTKHACDECRRSQKKCDGDKPLCRRCYLNGTLCTYTPHKSRNQCLCIGQGEEGRGDSSIPDVFVFADSSLSSFHTWSATTSPDRSPSGSEPALNTPPPTNLGQDTRFGSAQNAVLELPAYSYESEIICSPETAQRVRDTYNHRSSSLPNFSCATTVTPSPPATEFSSYPLSVSLPRRFVQQPLSAVELRTNSSSPFDTEEANRSLTAAYLSTQCDITFREQDFVGQRSAESRTFFDVPARQCQQISEARVAQQQASILASSESVNLQFNDQIYDPRQYAMSRSSNGAVSTSVANGYSPNSEYATNTYSQWLAQVHANGIASSHEGLPATTLHAPQNPQSNAGTIPGYSMPTHNEHPPSSVESRPYNFTNLASTGTRRHTSGMTLHDLPSPSFSNDHWMNGPVSPPLSGSYSSSVKPSPSAYGNDAYEWSY